MARRSATRFFTFKLAVAHARPVMGRKPTPNGRIFASPLARRMAQQARLDLAAITGSGPQGRVVKSDIEAALSAGMIAVDFRREGAYVMARAS